MTIKQKKTTTNDLTNYDDHDVNLSSCSNFAIVSRSSMITISNEKTITEESSLLNDNDHNNDNSLISIYEQYASLYPNISLVQEYQQRDYLLQALNAANHAQNTLSDEDSKKKINNKRGFFQKLFGSSQEDSNNNQNIKKKSKLGHNNNTSKEIVDDDRLQYIDIINDDNDNDDYCGTKASLDMNAIPYEAHTMARYHIVSSSRYNSNNIVRQTTLSSSTSTSTRTLLVVIGLGEFMELDMNDTTSSSSATSTSLNSNSNSNSNSNNNNNDGGGTGGIIHYTTDRVDLIEQSLQYNNDYTRASLIGDNFLIVSWGYISNRIHIMLYRKVQSSQMSHSNKESTVVSWQLVGYISPSPTVQQQMMNDTDDIFDNDIDSSTSNSTPLLNISDVIPIIINNALETNDDDVVIPPGAIIAISRIGGYIELLPLPTTLWYGPVLDAPNSNTKTSTKKKNSKKNKKNIMPLFHYLQQVPNLTMLINPRMITAITTSEYHNDIMGIEILYTNNVNQVMEEDVEEVPKAADCILIAHGARLITSDNNDDDNISSSSLSHETISFWSIHTVIDVAIDGIGFFIKNINMEEALDIGSTIPSSLHHVVFASSTIMKYWRKPRHVELKEQKQIVSHVDNDSNEEVPPNMEEVNLNTNNRVTTISIPIPIVNVKFITVHNNDNIMTVRAALLDANGGVTILDCDLLLRTVTNILTEYDHQRFIMIRNDDNNSDDDEPPIIPLVEIIYNRSYVTRQLMTSNATTSAMKLPPFILDIDWLVLSSSLTTNKPNGIALSVLIQNNNIRSRRKKESSSKILIWMDDFVLPSTTSSISNNNSSSLTIMEAPLPQNVQCATFFRCNNNNNNENLLCLRFIQQQSQKGELVKLCAIREVHTRDMIQTYINKNQLKDAIIMYEKNITTFTTDEHNALEKLIINCRKQLWEIKFDTYELDNIKDEIYFFKEIMTIISDPYHTIIINNHISIFRNVCQLALKRCKSIRMLSSTAKQLGGPNRIQEMIVQIQECYIKFGTYSIICHYYNTESHLQHFINDFMKVSIQDFAIDLATKSFVIPLSIVFYRHSNIMINNLNVLNAIQLQLSPCKYQHLLPVNNNTTTNKFMSGCKIKKDGVILPPQLNDYDEFATYLKNRFEVDVIVDENDRHILDESIKSELSIQNNQMNDDDIEHWYYERVKLLHQYFPVLDHVSVFLRLAQCACHKPDDTNNNIMKSISSSDNRSIQELSRIQHITDVIQLMAKDGRGFQMKLSSLPSFIFEEFETLSPLDLISVIMENQIGLLDIGIRYNRYLLPLMKQKFPRNIDVDKEISSLLALYCTNIFKMWSDNFDVTNNKSNNRTITNSVEICCKIARHCRTSIVKSKRIIKNVKDIIHFVFTTIASTKGIFSDVSLSIQHCKQIIDVLWTMYESLPTVLPIELHLTREETSSFVQRMDQIYRDLILMDILARWPNINGIPLVCSSYLLSSLEPTQIKEVISSLCHSYCAQVGVYFLDDDAGKKERIDLLVSLLADIEQTKLCFEEEVQMNSVTLLKGMYLEHLVQPLLMQQHVYLVGEFLSRVDPKYIEVDSISDEISIYFSDIVHGSAGWSQQVLDYLRHQMKYQEIFEKFLPRLRNKLLSIRKFLNATHYVNEVILAYTNSNDHVLPTDLFGLSDYTIVISVLSKKPDLVIMNSEKWMDPSWAASANASIRKGEEALKNKPNSDSIERQINTTNHTIPGQAVYQLEQILGIEAGASILAVRTQVIANLLDLKCYGGAAAVCRVVVSHILSENINHGNFLKLMATLVSNLEYEDIETKRELCNLVLTRVKRKLSPTEYIFFDKILQVSKQLEEYYWFKNPRVKPPFACIGQWFRDTKAEYSIDLADLFLTLRKQVLDNSVDDALLNTIGTYAAFWCIARCTRAVPERMGSFEKHETLSIAALVAFFMLHIRSRNLSSLKLTEVQTIFDNQKKTAQDKFPKSEWLQPDADIVRRLKNRGYSELGAQRAAVMSLNVSFDAAVQWAVKHSLDGNFDYPLVGLKKSNELYIDHDTIDEFSRILGFMHEILDNNVSFLDAIGIKQSPRSNRLLHRQEKHQHTLATELPEQEMESSMPIGTTELVLPTKPETNNEVTKPLEQDVSVDASKLSSSSHVEDLSARLNDHPMHKVVILISTQAFNRNTTQNQTRVYSTLKAHKIEYETLDASDKDFRDVRDDLIAISGLRGQYPQLFIVNVADGEATFWGDYDHFIQANDDGILVNELCSPRSMSQPQQPMLAESITGFDDSQLENWSERANEGKTKLINESTTPLESTAINEDVSQPQQPMLTESITGFDDSQLENWSERANEIKTKLINESTTPLESTAINEDVDVVRKDDTTPIELVDGSLLSSPSMSVAASANNTHLNAPTESTIPEYKNNTLFVTPTKVEEETTSNFIESILPPPGLDSPDRLAFLEAGQKAFARLRQHRSFSRSNSNTDDNSSNDNDDVAAKERQRLLEEGRRLLTKYRSSSGIRSRSVTPIRYHNNSNNTTPQKQKESLFSTPESRPTYQHDDEYHNNDYNNVTNPTKSSNDFGNDTLESTNKQTSNITTVIPETSTAEFLNPVNNTTTTANNTGTIAARATTTTEQSGWEFDEDDDLSF